MAKRKINTVNHLNPTYLALIGIAICVTFLFVIYHKPPRRNFTRHYQPSTPIFQKDKIILRGPTNGKYLTLTFDADMTPNMAKGVSKNDESVWYNKKVIEELRSTNTPATLFLAGMWIEMHPQISKELAGDPLFELANHSYSHPAFTNTCFGLKEVASKDKKSEILKTQKLLKSLSGKENLYFRFPGGCYSESDLQLARSLGVLPVQWTAWGSDAFNENVDRVVNHLKDQTQNGAIIVLHLHGGKNAPKTAEIIKKYIPWALSQGYTFVKLSQLLNQ